MPVGHSIWPAFIFIPQFSFEICIFFYHPVAAVVAAVAAAVEAVEAVGAVDVVDSGSFPSIEAGGIIHADDYFHRSVDWNDQSHLYK